MGETCTSMVPRFILLLISLDPELFFGGDLTITIDNPGKQVDDSLSDCSGCF
ncbi:MAG TPA: hypothetical protein VGK72_02105 [Chthoniobacterales bacterium]